MPGRKVMKIKFAVITFVLVAFLCSCDGGENHRDYQYELLSNLEFAISDLKSEIDDFSYQNWKDNILDVERAADWVESQFDDLWIEVYEIKRIEIELHNLQRSISDLKSEINDFSYQSWEGNVFDLKRSIDELESAFENIKIALGIEY